MKTEIIKDGHFYRFWNMIDRLIINAECEMLDACEADTSDRGVCSVNIGKINADELRAIADVMYLNGCKYWLDDEPTINPEGEYTLWVEARDKVGALHDLTWGFRRENPESFSRGNRREAAASRRMSRGGVKA